jgi:hypothetical protein
MDEMRDLEKWRKPPNPVTRAAHKKEFGTQVVLPLVLFLLSFAGAAWALIYYEVGSIARWSQVATIFLVIFWMVVGLIILSLLGALVYLVSRLLQLLPMYTRMAQDGIETIKHQVETGADITVKPVIKIQSFLAVIDALRGRR